MAMIERVARAISTVETGGDVNWRDYVQSARAAIKAMREPTPVQCEAALAALDDITVAEPKAAAWDAIRAYRAMIDAALKGEGR